MESLLHAIGSWYMLLYIVYLENLDISFSHPIMNLQNKMKRLQVHNKLNNPLYLSIIKVLGCVTLVFFSEEKNIQFVIDLWQPLKINLHVADKWY